MAETLYHDPRKMGIMTKRINVLNLVTSFVGTITAAGIAGWLIVDLDTGQKLAGGVAAIWSARLLVLDYGLNQRKQLAPVVVMPRNDTVKLNGRDMLLSLVPWSVHKPQAPTVEPEFIWYVRDYKRFNPVAITESQLYNYCQQGYGRQLRGDGAPFSRKKFFDDGWRDHLERGCKTILTYSYCFDTWGRGSKSKLTTRPIRAMARCKGVFPPTPLSQHKHIAAIEAGSL